MTACPLTEGSSDERTAAPPNRAQAAGAGSSVWPVAQHSLARQRQGRYVPASGRHPGRMAPDLAAYAIHAYTKLGDLVLDPMCGIGTTLVEAAHAARAAYGIEYDPGWAQIARDNADLAHAQGARTRIYVRTGDAQDLTEHFPPELSGTVALVLTSPPYGSRAHARVATTQRTGRPGIERSAGTYLNDPNDDTNLANAHPDTLIHGLTRILTGCARLLRPDGTVVITARPWRRNGDLVDLSTMITDAAEKAGLTQTDRCVALLAGIGTDRLTARPSFHQLLHTRHARAKGARAQLIAHEDVLIFQTRPENGSSPLNWQSQHKREFRAHTPGFPQ
jgi:modification methylase